MTTPAVSHLVETIRRQNLLKPRHLAKLTGSLQKRHQDPQALLQDLMRRGWLSPQQAGQLTGVPAKVPMGFAVPPAGVPMGMPANVPMGTPVLPPHELRRRSRYRWLQWNLVGLAVLIGLGTFLYHVVTQQQEQMNNPPPDVELAGRTAEAEVKLKPIQELFANTFANTEQLRLSLVDFRSKYPEVPQAVQASAMIAELPGPLDQLDRGQIPPEELFAAQPKNLVAVLGERRWRHWAPAKQVAFHPEGTFVASAGDDGRVQVWIRRTGVARAALNLADVRGLHFTLDGNLLTAVDGAGKATLWNVRDSQPGTVQGPVAKPTAIAMNFQGNLAASAADDASITLWEPAKGEAKAKLAGHRARVQAIAFAPNGQMLASGGDDNLAKVWNSAGQELFTIEGNNSAIRAVAFSPDNRKLAIAGNDREVRVFDIADLTQPKELIKMTGAEAGIARLAFNGSGRVIATVGDDQAIVLWDLERKGPFLKLSLGQVNQLTCHRDTLATVGDDGIVRLWNVIEAGLKAKEGQAISQSQENYLTGHTSTASAVAFLDTDNASQLTLASASWDRTVKFWNLTTARERTTLNEHSAPLTALAYNHNGKRLVSGGMDGTIKVWDATVFKESANYGPFGGAIQSLDFAADGNVFAAGIAKLENPQAAGELRVFGTWSLAEALPAIGQPHGVATVAFSPSGTLIYTAGGDGAIQIRHRHTGEERGGFKNDAAIDLLVAAPGGKLLASFDKNRTLKFWDLEKMRERNAVSNAGYVSGLAFSPDGKHLVTSHLEGKVILWDPATGKQVDDYAFPGAVRNVAFAPDSRHIATANANGTVYVLRLLSPPQRGR